MPDPFERTSELTNPQDTISRNWCGNYFKTPICKHYFLDFLANVHKLFGNQDLFFCHDYFQMNKFMVSMKHHPS